MEDYIVLEGKNKEELFEQAIKYFDVSTDELVSNILIENNKFFSKYYKIQFSIRHNEMDEKQQAEENNIDNSINNIIILEEELEKEYEIRFTNEGVRLSVQKNTDKKKLYNRITSYVTKKKIINFDKNKIYEAIDKLNKDVIIAPTQQEVILDDEVDITISKDNMSAFIKIISGDKDGAKITYDIAFDILNEKIKYGINKEILEEIIKRELYNKKILIAQGKMPKNGNDGYIDYRFNMSSDLKPSITEKGRVDFRDLGLINNVDEGEVLATINPPTDGINGINVLGEEVLAVKGKPAKVRTGKNTSLLEDKIISDIGGQVRLIQGKVEVLDIHNIMGNVDNHTGNISFNGTIVIDNCINSGFKVKALGDVYVNGVVEDALVKCGGNIYLAKGIVGKSRATLEANGEIISKYIENSTVTSKQDITADAILHSNVQSNSNIIVEGNKGLIVGGQCKAQYEIQAKTIGSPMETFTLIEVGINPQLKERLMKIKYSIDELDKDIEKVSKSINILERSYKLNNLSDKKIILFKRLLKTHKQLTERKNDLIIDYEEKEKELKILSTGTVIVNDTIYPGVKIIIGNHTMYIKKIMKKCKFTLVKGCIETIKL